MGQPDQHHSCVSCCLYCSSNAEARNSKLTPANNGWDGFQTVSSARSAMRRALSQNKNTYRNMFSNSHRIEYTCCIILHSLFTATSLTFRILFSTQNICTISWRATAGETLVRRSLTVRVFLMGQHFHCCTVFQL